MPKLLAVVILLFTMAGLIAQVAPAGNPLLRHYREGEKLSYKMKAVNEGRHYEIEADGAVKKDPSGYYEEYAWSQLNTDPPKATLTGASLAFRQPVTLDPNHPPMMPNLSKLEPLMIGPVTDLMTFYVDLWLAEKTGQLMRAGDHFYVKHGTPASWADGHYVVLGEDSIDFDLTLKDVNQTDNTATLIVRHVVPEKPEIKIPADWMRAPVAGTPNNWVQIQKMPNGKFLAAVGKETFDVEYKLSLADGKILSATMDNPVETIERECSDAALTQCGDQRPHHILRQVSITLVH